MTAADAVIVTTLLEWGEHNRRDLPWRHTRDPWAILVSEVMLQQTQVDRVLPKYVAFMERFPTSASCAQSRPADVIGLWVGLGYNRRALNLHRAARAIQDDFAGAFPNTLPALLTLPGVGPYTARAILVFAFEDDVAPVDTNIGRILARVDGGRHSGSEVQARADELLPVDRAWSWNQMLMDFGAAVCTRRNPDCTSCPIQTACTWAGDGEDPADGSAFVGRGQSRFDGSDRQGRGRLIAALARGDVLVVDVAEAMGWPKDPERAQRVLDALVGESMVEIHGEHGEQVRLAG